MTQNNGRTQLEKPGFNGAEIVQNVVAGLTVSFVAISLGAAFGVLSGRGAYAGIISAGVIAFITALLGGTRIQCSGPTAPMTAVTLIVVTAASQQDYSRWPGVTADHFINLAIIMTGLILIVAGIVRLGRFIALVPKVVISGFMNGIAILIWMDQIRKIFGIGGAKAYEGPVLLNTVVAICTLLLLFILPIKLRRWLGDKHRFFPATLITIVGMSALVHLAGWDIERVHLEATLSSFGDFKDLLAAQFPTSWAPDLLMAVMPFALQLALLAYLDSLLTSLVIDKMTDEQTGQNKELVAQGAANLVTGFLAGIPGAQATIRSVLILKENATLRLAGIMVGVFVLIEMMLFQNYVKLIPQAVFAGLLIKVGYDVFDWLPVWLYARERAKKRHEGLHTYIKTRYQDPIHVTHLEMAFIIGTTLVTVVYNLNAAVIGFSVLFMIGKRFWHIRDLKPVEETGAMGAED
ncbi:SulP family inorganic anion transporter [Sulfidibacter corallicola]|uniref:SulP family inorganic anion transporter n=1 Tax=Sulfidibacter corallicola TaxID=2818388 RepID=A0A8A4THS4_SULCO|nr:SulP family inorganic anion transporter [Sulfidibacter corallicola]QTD48712.1 SulP family inorganic anion transporter [Sulfidibacter corallicola]